METDEGTSGVVIEGQSNLSESPELTTHSSGPDAEVGATPTQPTGINPAWTPIRDVLGEDLFNVQVAPHLQKMDDAANTRITNLSSQLKGYEGYAPLVEQGINPGDIQMALQLRNLVESDPQTFYQQLGTHLGISAEEVQEGLEEFGAGQDGAEVIPPHILARLEKAEQFQQQFIQQQQEQHDQQQFEQIVEQETKSLDDGMATYLSKNPSFTEDDRKDLFRIMHELTMVNQSRGLNRMATPEEAGKVLADQHAGYARRFGGGAGAPSTLPTTTGGNIPGAKPDVGKMGKEELSNVVAQMLANQRQD